MNNIISVQIKQHWRTPNLFYIELLEENRPNFYNYYFLNKRGKIYTNPVLRKNATFMFNTFRYAKQVAKIYYPTLPIAKVGPTYGIR